MTIIPAIDLIGGRCVRLSEGDFARSTTYSDDPVKTAVRFEELGARRIHLVDLDAARGVGDNRKTIRAIRKAVHCMIEVGGGIRSRTDVTALVDLGIDRLILGTIFVKNPDEVARWVAAYGTLFIAGIDARDGKVKIAGWETSSEIEEDALTLQARDLRMCAIVYTNIARDGLLTGPDLERTNQIAELSRIPVILSGGIGSDADLDTVAEARHPGVVGVITGKAIYENRIDLAAAFRTLQQKADTWMEW